MRRSILAFVALTLLLPGCALLEKLNSNTIPNVTARQVYELKGSYDVVRAAFVQYRSLPWCSDQPAPCQKVEIARQIKAADASAMIALDVLQKFQAEHDTINLGAAYDAATKAIQAATQIAAAYGVH
jgi:hypothetical protein